jgi:hypothetical protein
VGLHVETNEVWDPGEVVSRQSEGEGGRNEDCAGMVGWARLGNQRVIR